MGPALLQSITDIYDKCGLKISKYVKELESTNYSASDFILDNAKIKFRSGKVTPTKKGLFTTFWKREGNGPIMPYALDDPFDLYVVSVKDDEYCGQFVFPKEVLYEKGIISGDRKEGKRAIRVYPPWVKELNKQAKKTQDWQILYFFKIKEHLDVKRIQKLFLI